VASVLHGSARTTPRLRAELQASKESTRSLAVRYGLNPKTVDKWRKRATTCDAPMGPGDPKSTVLTPAEEAIVVEFRRRTLLPLDDVLGCLKDTIPTLSRSALHRCLQRHGISRLPAGEAAQKHKRFKTYEIGYVHIDSCELRHADEAHALAFVTAYNFAKHLKALRWRTPLQAICDAWTKQPSAFKINPHHLIPRPHT
jgi:transposase-like protein